MINGKRLIASKSLTKIAKEQLSYPGFIRVSQSYLVNINFISSINKKNKELVLSNEQSVPYTLTIKELFELMSNNNISLSA